VGVCGSFVRYTGLPAAVANVGVGSPLPTTRRKWTNAKPLTLA